MVLKYTESYDGTLGFTDTAPAFALAASAALSYTVPGNNQQRYVAEFSYNNQANVFVSTFGTAAVPSAGTVSASSRSEFRPLKRFVSGGDVISVITPDTTAYVGLSLRQIPNP